MKKLNLLKTTLDYFWTFSFLLILGLIILIPYYLFSGHIEAPIKIGDQIITTNDNYSKIFVIVGVISGLVYVYSKTLLRNVVICFQNKDIFNDIVIRNFNKIGKLIIISTLLTKTTSFGYRIFKSFYLNIENPDDKITLDFGNYNSFLVTISLGLFFMVISEVFKTAKELKEENDLTV